MIERGFEVFTGKAVELRVAGWILLIAGGLLCATLVWATLGFLLLGVGLLSLLVAENNRKRITRSDESDAWADEAVAAPPPMAAAPPIVEPILEPALAARREPAMGSSAPASSYDRQQWQRLLDGDEDLARVASVLADYGHQYVDELAREYLAAADKARLPEIVDGIIGRAGTSSAPRINVRPESEAKPATRVRRTNLMAPRPDRQPKSASPANVKISETLPDPEPQAVEPSKPETISAPVPPTVAAEPDLAADDRNKAIISADEDLTAMLGMLAPDAATPSKN